MPSESVLARIAEFLETLISHPTATAQYLDSPETALATHGLSESDLQGVDLASVAGGLAGSGGLSPEGRQVLVQFATHPPSHGTPVQHIGNVAHAAHPHDATVNKVYVDNRQIFNIDNSVNVNAQGSVINGDINVTQHNDTTIATGNSTAFGAGSHDNAAAGDGGIAAGGNVTQASGGSVIAQGSGSGGSGSGGSGSGGGHDGEGKGGHDGGSGDQGHDGGPAADQGHHDGTPDISFGDGDTGQQDGGHDGKHDGHPDGHGQHGLDDQHGDPSAHDGQPVADGQGGDPGADPTAAAPDPTLIEGHGDPHFAPHDGQQGFDVHDPVDHHHDPAADAMHA